MAILSIADVAASTGAAATHDGFGERRAPIMHAEPQRPRKERPLRDEPHAAALCTLVAREVLVQRGALKPFAIEAKDISGVDAGKAAAHIQDCHRLALTLRGQTPSPRSTASRKASVDDEPDPTWNETPTTLRSFSYAASSSFSVLGCAPYLLDRTHCAWESSTAMRKRRPHDGWSSLILPSSCAASKTVRLTPTSRARLTCVGCLIGLA